MTLGEKIKEARKSKGYSQIDLAQKIGKGRRTIIDWESDKALPRTRKAYQDLADVLEVPVSYLLTDDAEFIVSAGEQYGYRGARGAEELMNEVTGLFSGGKMQEEDMDAFMFAVQQAYLDAKMKNKKYTPKKYLNNTENSSSSSSSSDK